MTTGGETEVFRLLVLSTPSQTADRVQTLPPVRLLPAGGWAVAATPGLTIGADEGTRLVRRLAVPAQLCNPDSAGK